MAALFAFGIDGRVVQIGIEFRTLVNGLGQDVHLREIAGRLAEHSIGIRLGNAELLQDQLHISQDIRCLQHGCRAARVWVGCRRTKRFHADD